MTIAEARDAFDRRDWDAAIERLSAADKNQGLSPEDLLLLGDALWWTGRIDEAIDSMERAYTSFAGAGQNQDAAKVGVLLAYLAFRRQSFSVARGWTTRVEHLLEGEPESAALGWLQILYVAQSLMYDVDLNAAISFADRAIELAATHDDSGVAALAMSFKGIALIQKGQWREGLSLVDEAAAVAMSGPSDLRAASDVYCNTIAVCRNLGDYRRAGEWTDEADRWMQLNSIGGYTGICQVHRAELKRLHGSWAEAEKEARVACLELERFRIFDGVGYAYYEIAEVRRRMGDLEAAEEAYRQAYDRGHGGQPGRSLLLLDRGLPAEALASIDSALQRRAGTESAPASLLARGRLLPAKIEIALANDDVDAAREAAKELEAVASEFEGLSWEAASLTGRGAIELADGEAGDAVETLGKAWRLWQRLDLPYEAAKARVMLAEALRGVGDSAAASLEHDAARRTFEKLGAAIDLRRLREIGGDSGPSMSRSKGSRVAKAFMFTDLVNSTDLIGLIGDSAWENLLEWHNRALREAFVEYRAEEVRHTGDGFFVAFDDPRAAIDCAVRIQRLLREHRHEHGFAPWVRIGVHFAPATRKGSDYAGQGVHEAARIGAIAGSEEIVVSSALLSAAGEIPHTLTDPETVKLKGITEPAEIRRVEWEKDVGRAR